MENPNIIPFEDKMKKEERIAKQGHKAVVVWFTGLSGSGKSTIASGVEKKLFSRGIKAYMLDADSVRKGLNKDLGFSDEDRLENMRRAGEVAKLFIDSGNVVLACFISPHKKERELVRNIAGNENFLEIFVDCPIEECIKRDSKGIYEKYKKGEIKNFSGIDIPYEKPENPHLTLNSNEMNVEECVNEVLDTILPKISEDKRIEAGYNTEHLKELESEAIYILRETAAQFERPVIMFSGGKDSLLLLHLARKAFYPAKIPFPVLHIDTGHNFQEALDFRDDLAKKWDFDLIVRKVQDSIDKGRAVEEKGVNASRNVLQTVTLLDAISEFKFDAAIGGGRRDEEKARAKERFFSHRDVFGQWDPKNQRPELWNLFNGLKNQGEHFRVFPLSNWTELDVWQYIKKEKLEIPCIYFSHMRDCIERDGTILAYSDCLVLRENEKPKRMKIRFRTVGDMTCTGAVISEANSVSDIINEIAVSRVGERGTRFDDKRSDCAMEDRKKEGYF